MQEYYSDYTQHIGENGKFQTEMKYGKEPDSL